MDASGGSDRRRRLTIFYACLGVLVVVGSIVVFVAGADRDAERSIAGRYEPDIGSFCLGRTFDIRQSGQFAWISNADGTPSRTLRVSDGEITGEVECLDGSEASLDLQGEDGLVEGLIGEDELSAALVAGLPPPEAARAVQPRGVNGDYTLAPATACLGGEITLSGSNDALEIDGSAGVSGTATYYSGVLLAKATCQDGTEATFAGDAADRKIRLRLATASEPATSSEPIVVEATKKRDLEDTVGAFLLATLTVMIVARLFGEVAVRLRQPRVMGEVVAGISLGPSILGAVAPSIQAALFPSDLVVPLGVAANLGVIFFMFMVGAEVELGEVRRRFAQSLAISNGSVAIPMVLGMFVALPVYELVGPDVDFTGFALFMGVAMSITAFPVLARILAERGMLTRKTGVTALAAAAIDDVTAWFLIALASAFAAGGSGSEVAVRIAIAVAFCTAMIAGVRPLIARAFGSLGESKRLPTGWLLAVLAGVLLSSFLSETIGIAVIFGAFLMGLIMPRGTGLTEDAVQRIEGIVVLVLLPLFFAYTGLRTNIGLLDTSDLWLLTGGLLLVAIAGKFAGAMIGARVSGISWRTSAVMGTLMNTRGLTELIALNIALDIGVISEALFTALVLMALVTTFMAGPLLNLLDPRNTLGSPTPDATAR